MYHLSFVIDRLIQLIYVHNTLKTHVTIQQTNHKINKIRDLIRYKLWIRGCLCGSLVRSTDFLMYYISHQKQRDYSFFYNIDFLFLSFFFSLYSIYPLFFSFYFLFSPFHNLLTQNYKKMLDWKNFNVDFISLAVWIVRDKVRCWLYCVLLTRYLALVYIDLLTKILGGISVVSQKIIIREQPMNGLREDW